jgi:Tfp pilus assembly protein PilP
MTTLIKYVIVSTLLLLFGCSNKPTLQKYFVEKTESSDFIILDLTPKMLKIDETKLSVTQKKALASFEKINVLAFKVNDKNKARYDVERNKVKAILKDPQYEQLMKVGSGKEGAQVSLVGEGEHISEIVIFGNKNKNGFAVARVLGKDMDPNTIIEMVGLLKVGNISLDQLKPLQDLMK